MAAEMQPDHQALGIRANFTQFGLQLVQVFFVGLTLGMMRTVVPALAEHEFGLPKDAFGVLVTFVIAFGIVKGVMNLFAGRMSETLGRKRVLVVGWLVALPIPFMIRFGESWNWIVAATILLGANQGLAWTMTITSKLDLSRADQRGLTNGLNEFCGYFAVAIAGIVTGYLADSIGARTGLFIFGLATIIPALLIASIFVRNTRRSNAPDASNSHTIDRPVSSTLDALRMTWTNRRFLAVCQAGLVEKFVDALMWLAVPVFLVSRGVDVSHVGWVPGVYAATWGASQLFTGSLSDRIGRTVPITGGMMMCGLGVIAFPAVDHHTWWTVCALR
jgi:MFS family permease